MAQEPGERQQQPHSRQVQEAVRGDRGLESDHTDGRKDGCQEEQPPHQQSGRPPPGGQQRRHQHDAPDHTAQQNEVRQVEGLRIRIVRAQLSGPEGLAQVEDQVVGHHQGGLHRRSLAGRYQADGSLLRDDSDNG